MAVHKFWHANQFPSVASCCNKISGGIDGLITGHAYSFLDVQELRDSDGNIAHTIAKVRNPWGSEKYTGKFSDNDDLWTQEWKDQVNLKVADDGIFWMPYQNFITYFDSVDVAFYGDYKHVAKNFKPSEKQTTLVVNNPVAQYVYITGELTSDRLYPRAKKCTPNNNIVLYFEHLNGSPVNKFKSYEFI